MASGTRRKQWPPGYRGDGKAEGARFRVQGLGSRGLEPRVRV